MQLRVGKIAMMQFSVDSAVIGKFEICDTRTSIFFLLIPQRILRVMIYLLEIYR